MIERHVVVPVGPDALWEALTEPGQVGAWFGRSVEWDLVPGGRARWSAGDGDGNGTRLGVIDDVAPARRLSFRWWPQSGPGPASQVTYELESADDSSEAQTLLTVRETPIPAPDDARPATEGRPVASAMAGAPGIATPWDTRHVGLWLHLQARALVTV